MPGSKRRTLRVRTALSLAAVAVVVLWWQAAGRDSLAPGRLRPAYTIEGLSYLEQSSGLVLEIEMGHIDLRRPRFGFLSVGPRNELSFRDLRARVEVLAPDAASEGLSLESVRGGILGMMPARATRAVRTMAIETLRIELVDPRVGGLVLSAAKASLLEGQRFRLSGGLSVMTSMGERLHASQADWLWGSKALAIRGRYTLLDGEGKREGRDSRIVFDAQGRLVVEAR